MHIFFRRINVNRKKLQLHGWIGLISFKLKLVETLSLDSYQQKIDFLIGKLKFSRA